MILCKVKELVSGNLYSDVACKAVTVMGGYGFI
jgi:hypothetical protein